MQDVRPRLEGEVDECLGARKIRPCVREKIAGDKNPVMGVKRALELPGDDGAAQFDRQGFDGQVIPRLVDGMVEGPSQGQLSLPRHARSLLVEKRDLAQQPIFRGCERGAVEDADLMAEIVGGTRQHARVCRDACSARQGKVQTIEDDALGSPTRSEWYRRHFTPDFSVRRRERLTRVFVAPIALLTRIEVPRVHWQLSDIAPHRDFRGQRPPDCQELPTLGQDRLYRRDDRGGDAAM
jgi:hypothetical protein